MYLHSKVVKAGVQSVYSCCLAGVFTTCENWCTICVTGNSLVFSWCIDTVCETGVQSVYNWYLTVVLQIVNTGATGVTTNCELVCKLCITGV